MIRKNVKHLLATLVVLAAVLAGGHAVASSTPILTLGTEAHADLAPAVRIIEDPQKNFSFRTVLAQHAAGNFTTPSGKSITASSKGATWYVFTISNKSTTKDRWMLNLGGRAETASGLAERVALFSDASPDHPLMIDGRLIRNKVQLQGQRKNALVLPLTAGETRTFALYVEPTPGLPFRFQPQVETASHYAETQNSADAETLSLYVVFAILAGVMALFLLWYQNLIPALMIAYLGAQLLFFVNSNEIIPQGNNTAATYIDLLAAAIAVLALGLTQQVFFSTSRLRERSSLVTLLVSGVIIAIAQAGSGDGAVISHVILLQYMPPALSAFIAAVGAVHLLRVSKSRAFFYTLAWAVFLAGTMAGLVTGRDYAAATLIVHAVLLAAASLHLMLANDMAARRLKKEQAHKRTEEQELQKTHEQAHQARLLGVMQREKELMADLRKREAERAQALQQAKIAADNASKAKSEFLAVISHEIRTPMTGIMGMIRLLEGTPLNSKQQEWIQTMQYAGDALLGLLNNLLDLSKAEEGRMEIETISFDLGRLVNSMILLMSGRADEKKIYLKADIESGTPLLLRGDPSRLRQILLNLIGNAIKFTETGGVTLAVRQQHDSTGRLLISFAVTDTGIGISPEGQKKLFQPYAQADASTARKFGGTGLGLSISKKLVTAMGGNIKLESRVGQGSTFSFTLPFTPGSAEAEAPAALAAAEKPLHVLVVDDNTINQQVIAGLLAKRGHTAAAATSAEAGIALLKEKSFDAVLMDMEMPGMDGPTAARVIRQMGDKAKAGVPIIALTGNTIKEDIARCLDAGMNDYCPKPITPEKLYLMLDQAAKKEGAFRKVPTVVPLAQKEDGTPAFHAPAAPPLQAQAPAKPKIAPTLDAEEAPTYVVQPARIDHDPAHAAAEAPHPQLFDDAMLATLKNSLGADDMNELMKGFYEKAEQLIAAAEGAARDKDVKALTSLGHDLGGMTANFGFTALGDVARNIERLGRDNAATAAFEPLIAQLGGLYKDSRSAVDAWLKK